MIERDKRHIYLLALFYSVLVVMMISIPAYYYVRIEIESYRMNQLNALGRHAYGLEESIAAFSRGRDKVFRFPRSLFYDAYLFDENNRLVFSTTDTPPPSENTGAGDGNMLIKKIAVANNRLGVRDMVITRHLSYRDIYTKAALSALFLGAIIFFLTLFFIKASLRPMEKANRYLMNFFNDAMHELRTPLGVMQLNLDMLANKQKGQSGPELQRLSNSLQNITHIYDDIEYLIKHQHVEYRPEEIDFSELLAERIAVFTDLANPKSIALKYRIAPGVKVNINRIELQRIIDNTLSNAIKYSRKGANVSISLEGGHAAVKLSVCDQGVGIEDTGRIFERFRREDVIKGGFGIGLSIVKSICDKNGIDISVESEPGVGSCFIYSFRSHPLELTGG